MAYYSFFVMNEIMYAYIYIYVCMENLGAPKFHKYFTLVVKFRIQNLNLIKKKIILIRTVFSFIHI